MRADARAKRDQIVTAALAQIGTRSNSEITLEGIAADADVGIATLYRHFPTRAALYDACAIVFLERIESLLDDALDGFEDNPVEHFESFVWALVESGVGILATALAADSSDDGLGARRDAFMSKVQLLIDAAAPHGIIAPGQSPTQLATELVVATRPLAAPLADILPDVRDRLVRHLMAGWRTTA